jgi:hypothetical protein
MGSMRRLRRPSARVPMMKLALSGPARLTVILVKYSIQCGNNDHENFDFNCRYFSTSIAINGC